ncbi:MAG: hypothetical protein SPL25_04005 [Succinivibrionaceae bacterium]|nr:hypothetical protein [Succinivibrionaceae bacterium]
MAEEKQEEQGLKCPICGKKLEDNFFEYHCDNCKFKVQHVISGTKIEDEELQKIFAGEVSQVHEFTSAKTGNTYKAKLRLSADKLKVDMVYDWDSGLKCPKCGKKIMESGKGFFCEGGDFKCWREISGTEISREELQKALEGQGDELGFRSHKTGKTFLARLVLNEAKDGLEFKFAERKSEDTGLKCPHCGKKILETDKGFFCEGKDFKCWKSTRGHEISSEELQKILEGQCDELGFVGKSSGKTYKGRLVLNEAKDGLEFKFADSKKEDISGAELTDIARDGGSGAGEGQ